MIEIDTQTLRLACERIIDHLEKTENAKIMLDEDFYWNIPEDTIYNMSGQPTNLDIGQLSDDWKEVQAIVHQEKDPVSFALVWLGAIMRAIGEKVVR